ncbi:MAG: pseudouridine synthase [Patescibacteria group bacterium]
MSKERLQKILARAGVASRRKAEAVITAGRVKINGQVVTELGTKADPDQDKITIDGKLLDQPSTVVYIVNKPAGVVTTTIDPQSRNRVIDLVPSEPRVFAVGRLDRMTEGLILLTNDGELAQRLTHPSYEHQKEYLVTGVASRPVEEIIRLLKNGIRLDGILIVPDEVRFEGVRDHRLTIAITVHQGQNHLIRRLCPQVGLEITRLVRSRLGSLTLEGLALGKYRRLGAAELALLVNSSKRSQSGLPPARANPSADR